MTTSNWDESLHPRDNEGRFTYKNGSSSSHTTSIRERIEKQNKEREKLERMAEILYPNMKARRKPYETPPFAPEYNDDYIMDKRNRNPEDILYPTMKNKGCFGNGQTVAKYSNAQLGGDLAEQTDRETRISVAIESETPNIKRALVNDVKNLTLEAENFLHSKEILKFGAIEKLCNKLKQSIEAVGDFGKNYVDIRKANTKGADKYFHAKANCEAAQHGEYGVEMARKISDTREDFDLIKNKYKPKKDGTKMTRDEIIQDYESDQKANVYGRGQGLKNPNVDCKILVDKYRPDGLNERY